MSVSNADGGVGERDGANRPLSPGEAKLWAKLAELKELPVHDSLAGFPEELGEPADMRMLRRKLNRVDVDSYQDFPDSEKAP